MGEAADCPSWAVDLSFLPPLRSVSCLQVRATPVPCAHTGPQSVPCEGGLLFLPDPESSLLLPVADRRNSHKVSGVDKNFISHSRAGDKSDMGLTGLELCPTWLPFFLTLWGGIRVLVHSGCWQNSCGCRTASLFPSGCQLRAFHFEGPCACLGSGPPALTSELLSHFPL